jgi:hypothetical protein
MTTKQWRAVHLHGLLEAAEDYNAAATPEHAYWLVVCFERARKYLDNPQSQLPVNIVKAAWQHSNDYGDHCEALVILNAYLRPRT